MAEDGVAASDSLKRMDTPTLVAALAKSPAKKALQEVQKRYPWLAQPTHDLHQWVEACEEALREGDEAKAHNILERIQAEVDQERRALEVAFKLFSQPGQEALNFQQVQVMLEYLGFPSSDADTEAVLKAVDKDGDGTMAVTEFELYVGRMGGSHKLFELRRKRMAAKHGVKDTTGTSPMMLQEDLKAAGILEQEQAYWSLVLPRAPEEFKEVSCLQSCQSNAVSSIRRLARSNHQKALPQLQLKVKGMGYADNDLWMCLAYIRELAPIIIHINLAKTMGFLESDTHYRNQFETKSSGGLLKPEVREKWEKDLFGGAYDKATGFDRCKYGVLNVMNDYQGVVKCAQYGDSYMVLKDCRLRCTFSPEDSANLKSERLAVLDYYAHVLNEYSTDELKETIKIAQSSDAAILGDSSKVGNMKYKEAQLHGEVCFKKHVERLVAHTRHRDKPHEAERLKKICEQHGWVLSWMDKEQERMGKEDKAKLGEQAWKEKLKAIMEKGAPDVPGVPKGFCRKGCSRKVHPGVTAKGNEFTTCCRGCALGFGHDLSCGNVDAELLKPGLCQHGCGRPVNPGTTRTGAPYITCCRGCAYGTHDAGCGKEHGGGSGLCKEGCGRKVAPPAGGRHFNTCCVKCAKSHGEEHNPTCVA